MKIFYSIVLLTTAFSAFAAMEELSAFSIVDAIAADNKKSAAVGRIQEIDLIRRTIVISGIKYFLGPSTIDEPLEVRMMGGRHGSLELLKIDMFVEVSYIPSSSYRIARTMIQIPAQEGN